MRVLTRAAEAARSRTGAGGSSKARPPLTWAKAVVIGLAITASLIITLGFVPSIFTYWWAGRTQQVLDTVNRVAGFKLLKDPYMSVRIRDAISLGYQTTVFAAAIVISYIWSERRRRRLGQRGLDDVKGYLPGK